MVTQLPSTGKPNEPRVLCDTSDLIMIHGMFRKVYTDAPGLVSAVLPGNTAQRDAVADHIRDISEALHAHHHGEDILLWDQLTARAPSCVAHVAEMRAQHTVVAGLLGQVDIDLARWRGDDSAANRDAVARGVEAVRSALFDHLGDEERDIVPVAQQSMPQELWDKLGEHGRASVPRDRQFLQLGHILSSMNPDERAVWMKANLPAPVRLLWRVVGKRQFDAQAKAMKAA